MFKNIIKFLFKDFYIFTAAYSNNVFPEPLTKEEEYIKQAKLDNEDASNNLLNTN